MVNRRRKSFERAHFLLNELRTLYRDTGAEETYSLHKLQPLRSLQKLLIREIARAERKIQRSKSILKTLDVATAQQEALSLEERIEAYRHLAYCWRCFGDAIAFHFMDKFALKQTFFNTNNQNAKQSAGFLIGKEGLSGEMKLIETLLERGFPALLTDLTNTIRHGDVCVMLGPDPLLMEVKLGKLDRRGTRQKNSIRQLMNFFATDHAEELRGLANVRRVAHNTSEIVYIDAMNECIAAAMDKGSAWCSPEDGLHYIAIANDDIKVADLFAKLSLKRPMVFFLNEFKSRRVWSPYSPFTLSIQNFEALFRFIWEGISIIVIYDIDALLRIAEREGYDIEFHGPESDYIFHLTRGSEGPVGLATQMFVRLAFEFTSPTWIFYAAAETLDRLESLVEPLLDS